MATVIGGRRAERTGTPLTMRHVTRRFRGGAGVMDLDLEVQRGEIHALVGLNGAGKSTLMRLALGMLRPDAGDVLVHGADLRRIRARTWARVGHLVETPFAYPELTAEQNLRSAARLHGIPRRRIGRVVADGIAALGLERYAPVRARRLSLGNRQRLGLAVALQHWPELIVLDEPTNALDPAGTILLREQLRARADAGAAVLVSSHHLDEVARIASRITVLNRGRIVGALDPGGHDLERVFFDMVHADDLERGEEG